MKMRKLNQESLVGRKFYKLTVIQKTDIKKHGTFLYLCKCDCGNEKLVKRCDLIAGQQSCGCAVKERIGNLNRLPKGEAAINGLFTRYQIRSKIGDIVFSITKEAFKKLIFGSCFYCDERPGKHSFQGLAYNGIDRSNNSIGYVDSNVVTCCAECNWMKRMMDTEQFFEKISCIAKHHNLSKNSQ